MGKAGWSREPALMCPSGGLGAAEADPAEDNDI